MFCILYHALLKELVKAFKVFLNPLLGLLFDGVKFHSNVIYIDIDTLLTP